jgi:hypothetical protein
MTRAPQIITHKRGGPSALSFKSLAQGLVKCQGVTLHIGSDIGPNAGS